MDVGQREFRGMPGFFVEEFDTNRLLFNSMKILSCEETPVNQDILESAISSKAEASIIHLCDRSEVISFLVENGPVDLIILEWDFSSDLDGFGLKMLLNEIPEFAEIPIVAVSASESIDVVSLRRLRVRGLISMPVSSDGFIEGLCQILAQGDFVHVRSQM